MSEPLLVEAMVAPCDLWVLPTPRFSRWFTHLDWYFNWQMCKGLAYGGLHLPAETYRVAEEFGVPVSERSESEKPLLISCAGKVPAKSCLVLDSKGGLKEWLSEIKTLATTLKVSDVRVFLPTGTSVKDAEKIWKQTDFTVHFSPDLEPTT